MKFKSISATKTSQKSASTQIEEVSIKQDKEKSLEDMIKEKLKKGEDLEVVK